MTTIRELITELENQAKLEGDDLLVAICDISGDIHEGPVWINTESENGPGGRPLVYVDFDSSWVGGFTEEVK